MYTYTGCIKKSLRLENIREMNERAKFATTSS